MEYQTVTQFWVIWKNKGRKYEREKLEKRRDELISLSSTETDAVKRKELGKELNDIILKLVKIK